MEGYTTKQDDEHHTDKCSDCSVNTFKIVHILYSMLSHDQVLFSVKCISEFSAQEGGDLSFKAGEVLHVMESRLINMRDFYALNGLVIPSACILL